MKNRITELFGIEYPIIQAGMIWCSGWRLASAVSNAGGLGIIGSGSMYPDVLAEHIRKCKEATNKPFAVNIPMFYPDIDKHIQTILDYKVPIVFLSAGNPKTYTQFFHDHGVKVVHVVPGVKFAQKAEAAGVDAVVCEGFEAGGHDGRDETTTMCLIPAVRQAISIPLIAAGGIGSGKSMLAAMTLGAEGVQMGSRFIMTDESSAHANFKNYIRDSKEGDTMLSLKEIVPVRLMKNDFYQQIEAAYARCASVEELKELLGRARPKKGMFEGDLVEGELQVGQIADMLNEIKPAGDVVREIVAEYRNAVATIKDGALDI